MARSARPRKLKITQVHVHQLLWNLQAARSNLRWAPAGSGWQTEAPALIAAQEAELRRRGVEVPPEDTSNEQWAALLAAALDQPWPDA